MFQIFLNEFSISSPEEFKIIVLDNGAFHKTKSLVIPHNVALVFLPPYSPELNPAEKIWCTIKRAFTGKVFPNLNQLSLFIESQIKRLSNKIVRSICAFDYFFSCKYWTKLS